MDAQPIRRIGRFEMLSLLGAGGMGEVYRARDTRLGRDVAVKVLPPAIAGDRQAMARFEQEARAASALNHPNIITIFDVGEEGGRLFIVTELLAGETLRERLSAGPLPLPEAADVTVDAAAALAAAHAAGIVHRDVKPDNIFLVGKSRQVKLLDFGIARLNVERLAAGQTEAATALATSAGAFIGTPGYMAPEQVRGEQVDGRADIFALGCVLYEMLTGAQAFVRNTPIDTLAAVINDHPPIDAAAAVPRAVARVVARALQKDPAERFRSMEDFAFALTNAVDAAVVAGAVPPPRPRRTWRWLAAPAMTAAVVAAALLLPRRGTSPVPFALRASVVVPSSARPISPVLSPDGKWVGYIGLTGSRPDVYVQFLNGAAPVNLTRVHNLTVERRTIVGRLELSPDAAFIVVPGAPTTAGLWQLAGIWSVPAPLGGPPTRLPDRYAAIVVSSDGKRLAGIVANPIGGDALAVANSDGSDERVLVPAVAGVHVHQPAWSPDDRYVYYVRGFPQGEIFRVDVNGGAPEIVIRTFGSAMYPAPTVDGRALVYSGNHVGEGANLWWHPFDGTPERRLTVGAGDYTEPFLSRNGTSLVCLARQRQAGLRRVPADGTDGAIETFGPDSPGDTQPAAALNGERLFVASTRTGERRIWSVDSNGESAVPLSSGGAGDEWPAVSPDGRLVAFLSSRGGQRGLWVVPAEGGTPRLLVKADIVEAVSWASDGRRIVYTVSGAEGTPLWIVEADTGRNYRIPGAIGRVPGWSPRGDFIAVVRATNNVPTLHVIGTDGRETRKPVPLPALGTPAALSWAPDGRHIAVATLAGRSTSDAWVVDLDSDTLRRVVTLPAPTEMDGLAWSADGRWLIVGLIQYQTEVLLIEGLPRR